MYFFPKIKKRRSFLPGLSRYGDSNLHLLISAVLIPHAQLGHNFALVHRGVRFHEPERQRQVAMKE
jgi:hypothetical protein